MPRALARRAWEQGLAVHLVAYLALLAALLAVGVADGSFTSDEGAYYLQIELLEEGRWDLAYPLADLDPDGAYFPIINSDHADGRWYPYVKHPLYVHLLAASTAVLGTALGAHVWSLAGALGTAAAAWCLAGAFDRRLTRLAFWIAALGPPLANSQMVWAHTASAALGGFAALVVVRIVHDERCSAARAAVLSALLAAGVLVRTEGALWAACLLGAVAVLGWRWRRRAWLVGVGVAAAIAAVAFVAQRAWRLAIVGGPVESVPDPSAGSLEAWASARFEGAIDLVAKGADLDPAVAGVTLVAVVLVAVAAWSWRGGRPAVEAYVLVTAALALYLARLLLFDPDPLGGLFAAWPVVLFALLVLRRDQLDPAGATLAGALAAFALLVVLTQWDDAGGVQWGARYLSPSFAVVAALAAIALRARPAPAPEGALRPSWPASRRRAVPPAVVVGLLLVPALAAVVVPEQLRARHDELVDDATATGTPVVVSGQAGLPRFAWRTHDEVQWYRLDDEGSLDELLERLEAVGVDEVAVVSVDLDEADVDGWEVVRDEGGVTVLRVTA